MNPSRFAKHLYKVKGHDHCNRVTGVFIAFYIKRKITEQLTPDKEACLFYTNVSHYKYCKILQNFQ